MIITNKTKLTQEAVKGVMHASNFENSRYKTFKIIYNSFGLLFGMMFVRYLIFQMLGSAQEDKVMLWLYGIVGVVFLYIGLYGMDRSNLKKFQNVYKKMIGITFTYEIDSEGIKITDHDDDSDLFEWDRVIKWNQDTDNFYIFVGIQECLVISKKGFEQGTEKDFKELVKAVMALRTLQEKECAMEYTTMGKTGIRTSLLGFGCMRFPKNQDGSINQVMAEKMIDKAIAGGVTYIDTAYPYHNGESEPFVGQVLDKYDRSSYLLATKLPVWLVNTLEDAEEIFNKQLERLHKEHVDFYLLHALDKEGWEKVLRLDLIGFCEKLKAAGKIRAFGFSFHDEYDVFEEILTYRNWDFCQIQFNYMDTEFQAGLKGYNLAKKRHVPVVVMEPLRGGALADLQGDIAEILQNAEPNRSIASWGYRWVAGHDNVKVVLSGMSEYDQVTDNLNTFTDFQPLNEEEMKAIDKVKMAIESRVKNNCTGCRYCMPCPAGVNIPGSFQIWNTYAMYGNAVKAKNSFAQLTEKERPDSCVKCGKCEAACPQHIAIRTDLEEVTKTMAGLKNV